MKLSNLYLTSHFVEYCPRVERNWEKRKQPRRLSSFIWHGSSAAVPILDFRFFICGSNIFNKISNLWMDDFWFGAIVALLTNESVQLCTDTICTDSRTDVRTNVFYKPRALNTGRH